MILFAADWALYPTAFPDTSTRNQSFVRLAKLYQGMGIKNHAFLLALVNPHLKGIDPFDPNLSREYKDMVVVECKINPWYFFREVARVAPKAGEAAIPIEANRGNIALWWCFFNHIQVGLVQPRQTGKTLTVLMLMVYLLGFACTGTLINLLTKNEALRKENVQGVKDIFETLPPYLNQRNIKKDVNNTEAISVNSLGNNYVTHLPQASEKNALKVGRGSTSAINWNDEGPFCDNVHISLPAMFTAGNAIRERAARSGAPYGNILTTTAGKLDEDEGKFIYETFQKAMPWTERVFDCVDHEDLETMVRSSSIGGGFSINATFNHRQLGKSDQWLHYAMIETHSEGDAAARDYFNEWTSGTQKHPLTVELMKRIAKSKNPDPYIEVFKPENYIIRWNVARDELEEYMANNKVVLGIDTSNAGGNDDIGMVFVDAASLHVVGAATVNFTNILTYAEWLCDIICRFKNVTTIIEAKSSGPAILDVLCRMLPERGEDPFKRLFNTIVQEHEDKPELFNELRQPPNRRPSDFYVQNKKTFGFATSASGNYSRHDLYSIGLREAAKQSSDRVYDSVLISQIAGLTEKNGRIDHRKDGHDDMVVAWLLAHWMLTRGVNLGYYGLTAIKINIATDKPMTREEEDAAWAQQKVRDSIKAIADKLAESSDEYVCMKLEHEIRRLGRSLTYDHGQVNSVDQLINSIKDNRRVKRQSGYGQNTQVSDDDYHRSMLKLSAVSMY